MNSRSDISRNVNPNSNYTINYNQSLVDLNSNGNSHGSKNSNRRHQLTWQTSRINKQRNLNRVYNIDDNRRKKNNANNMRGIKYKPYDINDYRQHFVQEIQKPLGGIGANTGTNEWSEKAERRNKMINFAKGAENLNKYHLENSKSNPSVKLKLRELGVNKFQNEIA